MKAQSSAEGHGRGPRKGMRKRVDTQAPEMVRLNRLGWSARRIAAELRVDRGTVTARLKRFRKEEEEEHWVVVLRQVSAQHLEEHHRLLAAIAHAVLEAAHLDPLAPHMADDPRPFIGYHLERAVQQASDRLRDRGLDLDAAAGTGEGGPEALRLGARLLDALAEHEPELAEAFKNWRDAYTACRRARSRLLEEAENLRAQKKEEKVTPGPAGVPTEDELIRLALQKGRGDEPDKARRSYTADLLGGILPGILGCSGTETRGERGSPATWEPPPWLEQALHPARIEPLLTAHRSVLKSLSQVEETVDRLMLTGAPYGRCSLCPSYVPFIVSREEPGAF